MTNQEILTKATRKAIKGGYIDGEFSYKRWGVRQLTDKILSKAEHDTGIYNLIFSHDFAKALWGEEEAALDDLGEWHFNQIPDYIYVEVLPLWQYHLQQLVIADDVFKYLELINL